MSAVMPSLRSCLIASAALLVFVLISAVWIDVPLAQWLYRHAAGLVAPARSYTDTMTLLVQPALPKWSHPLVIAALGAVLAWRGGLAWARPFWLTAAVLLATRFTVTWLKSVFDRVRPYDHIADPELGDFWIAGHDSFPSGHSAVYMGLLLPCALLFPRARSVLLPLAVLCALARVAEGDHYLADVTASALIALLYTMAFGRLLGLRFAEARR